MKIRLLTVLGFLTSAGVGLGQSNQTYTINVPNDFSFVLIANELDHGSNRLNEVLPVVPDGSQVYFWDCNAQDLSPTVPTYNAATARWTPDAIVAPGTGFFITLGGGGPESYPLTFTGTPHVPVLPAAFPCGFGPPTMLSRQTNGPGTWENITGLTPADGDLVFLWNVGLQDFTVAANYGGVWFPSTPSLPVGTAGLFSRFNVTNIPCVHLTCPTNIIIQSCTNRAVNYSASAFDACTGNQNPMITFYPPSGTVFAPNTTNTVVCIAYSALGHATSCRFTVTVIRAGNCPSPNLYTATPLGTLGGSSSFGFAINASGQVTGYSFLAGNSNFHAFVYSNGSMTDLGTLGGANSLGHGINASGQVTGYSTIPTDGAPHAFLYSGGSMTNLGGLGGGGSYGYSINNSGQITGFSGIAGGTGLRAFLYSDGRMTNLGTLGGNHSLGTSINVGGQVTGKSLLAGDSVQHAILYSNASMKDLGTLGGSNSFGNSINDSGQVTGWATIVGDSAFHAFLYSNGSMKDLGTLGGSSSVGTSVNAGGQVIGLSLVSGQTVAHAFLYSSGTTYDLNSLVSGLPAGVYLGAPNVPANATPGINDSGSIIANGSDGMAYLLRPVPGETYKVYVSHNEMGPYVPNTYDGGTLGFYPSDYNGQMIITANVGDSPALPKFNRSVWCIDQLGYIGLGDNPSSNNTAIVYSVGSLDVFTNDNNGHAITPRQASQIAALATYGDMVLSNSPSAVFGNAVQAAITDIEYGTTSNGGDAVNAETTNLLAWVSGLTDGQLATYYLTVYYVQPSGGTRTADQTLGSGGLQRAPTTLQIYNVGGHIDLSWPAGTLMQSATPNGAYAPVPGAAAPFYRTSPTNSARFFRVGN